MISALTFFSISDIVKFLIRIPYERQGTYMSSLDLSSLMGISLGTLTLGKVISAAVTLLICLVVIRVLMKLLNRLLSRSKLDARVQ